MSNPPLRAGRVYRTEDLYRYGKNPTRLAGKLVQSGRLRQLMKGLYYAPRQSVFGEVPPSEDELLRAYFRRRRYLRTGPSVWNALALGATTVEAVPLVYNTTRTGEVRLGGRRFEFRRVRFPKKPSAEYFVVDLLENADRAGLDRGSARKALTAAVEAGQFDPGRLLAMAVDYGTRVTQEFLRHLLPNDGVVPG